MGDGGRSKAVRRIARVAERGEVDEAISMLRRWIDSDPIEVEPRVLLAELTLRGGDAASALAQARVALGLAPGYNRVAGVAAAAAHRLGRPDELVAMGKEIVEARPDDPDAHRALMWLSVSAGDLFEAAVAAEWLVDHDVDVDRANEVLEQIAHAVGIDAAEDEHALAQLFDMAPWPVAPVPPPAPSDADAPHVDAADESGAPAAASHAPITDPLPQRGGEHDGDVDVEPTVDVPVVPPPGGGAPGGRVAVSELPPDVVEPVHVVADAPGSDEVGPSRVPPGDDAPAASAEEPLLAVPPVPATPVADDASRHAVPVPSGSLEPESAEPVPLPAAVEGEGEAEVVPPVPSAAVASAEPAADAAFGGPPGEQDAHVQEGADRPAHEPLPEGAVTAARDRARPVPTVPCVPLPDGTEPVGQQHTVVPPLPEPVLTPDEHDAAEGPASREQGGSRRDPGIASPALGAVDSGRAAGGSDPAAERDAGEVVAIEPTASQAAATSTADPTSVEGSPPRSHAHPADANAAEPDARVPGAALVDLLLDRSEDDADDADDADGGDDVAARGRHVAATAGAEARGRVGPGRRPSIRWLLVVGTLLVAVVLLLVGAAAEQLPLAIGVAVLGAVIAAGVLLGRRAVGRRRQEAERYQQISSKVRENLRR